MLVRFEEAVLAIEKEETTIPQWMEDNIFLDEGLRDVLRNVGAWLRDKFWRGFLAPILGGIKRIAQAGWEQAYKAWMRLLGFVTVGLPKGVLTFDVVQEAARETEAVLLRYAKGDDPEEFPVTTAAAARGAATARGVRIISSPEEIPGGKKYIDSVRAFEQDSLKWSNRVFLLGIAGTLIVMAIKGFTVGAVAVGLLRFSYVVLVRILRVAWNWVKQASRIGERNLRDANVWKEAWEEPPSPFKIMPGWRVDATGEALRYTHTGSKSDADTSRQFRSSGLGATHGW